MGYLPYVRSKDLVHSRKEVGPVNSKDLAYVLSNSPKDSATTGHFHVGFVPLDDEKAEGSADLYFNIKDGRLSIENIKTGIRSSSVEGLSERLYKEGKLGVLNANFPNNSEFRDVSGCPQASKALEILVANLDRLKEQGYVPSINGFDLFQHMVETDHHYGNFGIPLHAYSGHIRVMTEPLIHDQEPRKLVLLYTQEGSKTKEFEAYQKILEDVKAGKSRIGVAGCSM